MTLNPIESQILTGAVAELERSSSLTTAEISGAGDRHERAKLRIARQCADDFVVRLSVRDWTNDDVQSGAGRVRVTRALKKLETLGYIERLEHHLGTGRTGFLRITPAGLAAAEAFQPAEHHSA